ncbi:MAG: hypothetical protein ABWY77_07770, partial [Acidimicrobiia bacterium]
MTPVVSSSNTSAARPPAGGRGIRSPASVGSIAAVGAGAVGVGALAIAGAAPIALGAILAAPAFVVGFVAARRRRARAVAAAAPVVNEDAATLASLDQLVAQIRGRVPDSVQARVERVAGTVRQTIPRLDQLGTSSVQAHAVVRTATSYLPEAVAAYLRLPRDYADRRPVSNGKTSLTILCDQLDLLGSKMDDL